MDLPSTLEAILFVAGEPVAEAVLARAAGTSGDAVTAALSSLDEGYRQRAAGVRLLRSPEGVQLVTSPEAKTAVEAFVTAGVRERLTPAAAETLAIIAYRGPVSRAAVEAIRGVNSSFTLRLLALRGLVTRKPHPKDARRYLYEVSAEFLRHLGVARLADLPQYAELRIHEGMTAVAEDAS